MKLYFMMGLPTETDEDIVAIARLADHVVALGQEIVPKSQRGSVSVSISVSVFIPKAHTPFQWCGQLPDDEVRRRQQLLIHSVTSRQVRVHYHDASTSLIEAVLSRGGRDLMPVIWAHGSAGRALMRGRSSLTLSAGRMLPRRRASIFVWLLKRPLMSTSIFPGACESWRDARFS